MKIRCNRIVCYSFILYSYDARVIIILYYHRAFVKSNNNNIVKNRTFANRYNGDQLINYHRFSLIDNNIGTYMKTNNNFLTKIKKTSSLQYL